MSDRVSVNHCVQLKLKQLFQHMLLELKCNMHPLNGISNKIKVYDNDKGYKVTVIEQWQMLYMDKPRCGLNRVKEKNLRLKRVFCVCAKYVLLQKHAVQNKLNYQNYI